MAFNVHTDPCPLCGAAPRDPCRDGHHIHVNSEGKPSPHLPRVAANIDWEASYLQLLGVLTTRVDVPTWISTLACDIPLGNVDHGPPLGVLATEPATPEADRYWDVNYISVRVRDAVPCLFCRAPIGMPCLGEPMGHIARLAVFAVWTADQGVKTDG